MYLEKILKKLFMKYNLAKAIRDECLDLMRLSDEDISPATSRMDGEIRGKGGLPRSIVESAVLRLQKQSNKLQEELDKANDLIEIVEELLSYLNPLEYSVIHHVYFSMEEDEEFCSRINISEYELKRVKLKAIDKVKYKIIRHL